MTRTKTPKVSRHFYDVLLLPLDPETKKPDENGEPTTHRVEVRTGDMTRGEMEAGKQRYRTPNLAPLANTACWVWASMVRTGDIKDQFPVFQDRALVIKAVKDKETGKPLTEEVDPT